jgi:hypothetical protein
MNEERETLKEKLASYRPGTADETDPYFAPVREALASDDGLAQQFEQHRNYDNAIASALSGIKVPDGLKASLLDSCTGAPARTRGSGIALWQWSAIAACLVAALILLTQMTGLLKSRATGSVAMVSRNADESWPQAMARWMSIENLRSISLVSSHQQLSELFAQDYRDFPVPPRQLGGVPLKPVACHALLWGGDPVTLTCLRIDGSIVHLLVVANPQLVAGDTPVFQKLPAHDGKNFHSIQWKDQSHSYLLLAPESASESMLRSMATGQNRVASGIQPFSHLPNTLIASASMDDASGTL